MTKNKDYRVDLRSNAAPFFSDTDTIYVSASNGMEALRKAVKDYNHPSGLFAAGVLDSKGKMVARYLCGRAATQMSAPSGLTQWRGDDLYVDDVLVNPKGEVWEEIT